MRYPKPALDAQGHLARLRTKGLSVQNATRAEWALSKIGYYRLLIYMRPFQDANKQFKPGVDFEQIIQLYEFDRELRLLCSDAIDRIEVALRSAIVSSLATSLGSHFHTEVSHFVYFGNFVKFWKDGLRISSTAIEHYRGKYSNPKEPPIWVLLEALTFGQVSTFFADLKRSNRQIVARAFGLHEKVLVNWFRALTTLRNKCAHHHRLWNATFNANMPMAPRHLNYVLTRTNTFQAQAVVIFVLLQQIDRTIATDWRNKLSALLASYSNVVDLQSMGFTPNDPFWRIP